MANNEKVRENRLRRWAHRVGYDLRKSRARNWYLENQGGYAIINRSTGFMVYGWHWDLDLDEVEDFFQDQEEE